MPNDAARLNIGDRVEIVSCEGFGGPATVTEFRDEPTSHYKVRIDCSAVRQEFWAHDFEIVGLVQPWPSKVDSRIDTYKHIQIVQRFLGRMIEDLIRRQYEHDQSKLVSPEVEAFDEFVPKLAGLTYGSEEYRAVLRQMKPAIDHHTAANSHHPEHYPDGIRGMNLLDLVEMFCDWKAASLRDDPPGDIRRSIEIGQQRFGYSDDLKQILLNTLPLIEATG